MMDHGIKISQADSDIITGKSNPSQTEKPKEISHILLTLVVPHLNGAGKQVARYKEAASRLKGHPIDAVSDCLHEASCLFEDLATIAKYIEMCDETHNLHQLFWDVRNLIRHDIRDKFDNDTSWKKSETAKRLNMPKHLQASFGFEESTMKVGGTRLELTKVLDYLKWAEKIIVDVIEDVKQKGYFSKN